MLEYLATISINHCPQGEGIPHKFGKLLFIEDPEGYEGNPLLLPAMAWAYPKGLTLINFDCDGKIIEELPLYEVAND